MKAVVQEHLMGCGVACVACAAGVSYSAALKVLPRKYASTRGFFCRELVHALARLGLEYSHRKVIAKTRKYLKIDRAIAFVAPSRRYPKGHYLVRTKRGWMNPWINFPSISVKAGFNTMLPGKAQWVIFPKQTGKKPK